MSQASNNTFDDPTAEPPESPGPPEHPESTSPPVTDEDPTRVAIDSPAPNAIVRCFGVTKTFRDFWQRQRVRAVNAIDLEIRGGEVFGLLGPNGSGKTTTIKMILGLLNPTAGRIAVFGNHPSDVRTKKRIGYLPEESYLYRFLDARETLDYYGSLFGLRKQQRRHRIDLLLQMVGLESVGSRPVGEYSTGMQRRIGLAQALINDPQLLILDEPTAGLDPIGTRQIKDLILELARRGKTILLCSHLLADVEDVCDRVAIMYGGKIRTHGPVDRLLVRQGLTTIQTSSLDDETLAKIDRLLQSCGCHIEKVEHPREKLEAVFLEVIHQAQAEGVATSGAKSGGKIAEFLVKTPPGPKDSSGLGHESGNRVIDQLLRPETDTVPESPSGSDSGSSPSPDTGEDRQSVGHDADDSGSGGAVSGGIEVVDNDPHPLEGILDDSDHPVPPVPLGPRESPGALDSIDAEGEHKRDGDVDASVDVSIIQGLIPGAGSSLTATHGDGVRSGNDSIAHADLDPDSEDLSGIDPLSPVESVQSYGPGQSPHAETPDSTESQHTFASELSNQINDREASDISDTPDPPDISESVDSLDSPIPPAALPFDWVVPEGVLDDWDGDSSPVPPGWDLTGPTPDLSGERFGGDTGGDTGGESGRESGDEVGSESGGESGGERPYQSFIDALSQVTPIGSRDRQNPDQSDAPGSSDHPESGPQGSHPPESDDDSLNDQSEAHSGGRYDSTSSPDNLDDEMRDREPDDKSDPSPDQDDAPDNAPDEDDPESRKR